MLILAGLSYFGDGRHAIRFAITKERNMMIPTKIYLLTISYGKHWHRSLHWSEKVAEDMLYEHMVGNWPPDLEHTTSKYSDLPRFRRHVVGVPGEFEVDELELPEWGDK